VDCEGDMMLCCGISSSGEGMVFGDGGGYLHLWASNEEPRVQISPNTLLRFPRILPQLVPHDPRPSYPQWKAHGIIHSIVVAAHPPLRLEHISVAPGILRSAWRCRASVHAYPAQCSVNQFSHGEVTGVPPPPAGSVTEVDEKTPLTMVPLYASSDETLLSSCPPNMMMKVGMPPHMIKSSLLKAMDQVDFVGYVANPEYQRGASAGEGARKVARMRNQRVEPTLKGDEMKTRERVGSGDSTSSSLPKGYCRVEIKQSQFRLKFEEFDFSYYNRTHFAGLENGIRNCYVNSLLQVLYFIPWLRVEVLKHICDAEFCLTCELGFLFHMLRIGARSTVCQASNLLRSLKQIREASALGLLEEPQVAEGPAPSGNVLGRRIQSFGRFMLEQSTKEMASAQAGLHDPNHLSAPARLFGSDVRTCTKCNVGTTETARESRSLHFDLHYPSHRVEPRPSFSKLLEQSLAQSSDTRAWCESCRSYHTLHQEKTLCSLPEVLLINSAITNHRDLFWWGVGEAASPGSPSPGRKTPLARDLRQQRLGTTHVIQGDDVDSVKRELEEASRASTSDVDCAVFELTALISHIREEVDDREPLDEPEQTGKRRRKPLDEGHLVAHIKLHPAYMDSPTVMKTGSTPVPARAPHPHLRIATENQKLERQAACCARHPAKCILRPIGRPVVPRAASENPETLASNDRRAELRTGSGSIDSEPLSWLLFNDFCITPTTCLEARTLHKKHKQPCLIFYSRTDIQEPSALPPPNITESHFFRLISEPRRPMETTETFHPLMLPAEAPRPGMLLAIDAEFVMYAPAEKEIRDDGTEYEVRPAQLGLARVSVVRGEGPRQGVCCIDDYVRTVEPVYDHLTRYSGLVPGDLDPGVSKHHITTLKNAYMKLRYLVDSGCRFVGHGLKKDFRMLNIILPNENVIDTVELFHFKRQRKLSLRFLASYLLKLDIQQHTHDSIEDAVTALRLYHKYLELVKAGTFQETLLEIYRYGKKHGWDVVRPGAAAGGTTSGTGEASSAR
ncbi:hypothetical protein CYMTET_34386, partial [Cymbomonas tetramitiformis]